MATELSVCKEIVNLAQLPQTDFQNTVFKFGGKYLIICPASTPTNNKSIMSHDISTDSSMVVFTWPPNYNVTNHSGCTYSVMDKQILILNRKFIHLINIQTGTLIDFKININDSSFRVGNHQTIVAISNTVYVLGGQGSCNILVFDLEMAIKNKQENDISKITPIRCIKNPSSTQFKSPTVISTRNNMIEMAMGATEYVPYVEACRSIDIFDMRTCRWYKKRSWQFEDKASAILTLPRCFVRCGACYLDNECLLLGLFGVNIDGGDMDWMESGYVYVLDTRTGRIYDSSLKVPYWGSIDWITAHRVMKSDHNSLIVGGYIRSCQLLVGQVIPDLIGTLISTYHQTAWIHIFYSSSMWTRKFNHVAYEVNNILGACGLLWE